LLQLLQLLQLRVLQQQQHHTWPHSSTKTHPQQPNPSSHEMMPISAAAHAPSHFTATTVPPAQAHPLPSIPDAEMGTGEILAASRKYRAQSGPFEWLASVSAQHSSNMSQYYLLKGTQVVKREKFLDKDVIVTDTSSVNISQLKNMARSRRTQGALFSELVFNIIFIAIYLSAVFMQLNAWNSFSSVSPMRALLAEPQKVMPNAGNDMRGFYDIGQPKDWWHWYGNIFQDSLLDGAKKGYNDKPLEPLQQDKVCWENKLLGGWTVQQWRSNIDDCTPTSVEFNICPGDDSGADVGPYGAALVFNQTVENASPFKFANRDVVVNGRTVAFQGYFVDVPLEEEKANAILANLLNNNWIDGQTRRLLVTLEAWNLQLDQVVVMFWETQINPGGHIRNFFSASIVRVRYYDKPEDQPRLVLEIIVVVLWFYYVYSEGSQVVAAHRNGFASSYWKSGWNVADILQIVLLLICIAMWIDVVTAPPPLPNISKSVLEKGFNDDTLSDAEVLQMTIVANKFSSYILVTSVHIFVLILKILKTLRVDQRLGQITNVISLMIPNLLASGTTFVTIFLFMTYIAYIFFGPNLEDWSTFIFAIGSSIGTFLGASDFDDQFLINPYATYIWHYLFIFLIVFMVINMVVAIVVESFEENFEFRSKNPYLEDSIIKTGVIFIIVQLTPITTRLGISLNDFYFWFHFKNDSTSEPAFYYDFADAALVMIDAADLPEDQEVVSVKSFCSTLEAKGIAPDSVRLVLQNFFECIYSARGDNESSDVDHKPHASFAAAIEAADTRTMEKFAHVAEKFVHKSVVAAIAPFKEAVMRFALLQADTVRIGTAEGTADNSSPNGFLLQPPSIVRPETRNGA